MVVFGYGSETIHYTIMCAGRLLAFATATLWLLFAAGLSDAASAQHISTDNAAPVYDRSSADALLLRNEIRHRLRSDARASRVAEVRTLSAPEFAARTNGSDTTGGIAGVVYGVEDWALDSAFVAAWSSDSTEGFVAAYARVQPDGKYVITGLPPGWYFVMASAEGYESRFYLDARTVSDAVPVEVTTAIVEGVDFRMVPQQNGTASIEGSVTAERTGTPIAGASVYAFDPSSPNRSGQATTGRDGSFTIRGLQYGAYVIQVFADGFLSEFFDDASDFASAALISVVDDRPVTGVDIALSAGGSIAGTVVDEDGIPVSGAFITAMTPGGVDSLILEDGQSTAWRAGGWAISGEDGTYRMDALHPGEYVVMAQVWSHWTYAVQWYLNAAGSENATPVAVAEESTTTGIDFTLNLPRATSSLSGQVRDADGDGIQGAYVVAELALSDGQMKPDRGYVVAAAVTDERGVYQLDMLPEGLYRVAASAQVGWEYFTRWHPAADWPEDATLVSLGADEHRSDIDITLPSAVGAGTVAGIVRDLSGIALAGTFVEIYHSDRAPSGPTDPWTPSFWAHAVSDSAGAYRIHHVPAGTYVVHAAHWSGDAYGEAWFEHAASPDQATPVQVVENETTSGIDFALDVRPIYGTVEGRVLRLDGAPMARAYVELSPIGGAERAAPIWYAGSHAVTDDAGAFRLEGVPAGAYNIAAYTNEGMTFFEDARTRNAASRIDVDGGDVVTVVMRIQPQAQGDGSISGVISADDYLDAPMAVDGNSDTRFRSPVDLAVVVAEPAGTASGDRFTAVSNADGSYRIDGLPDGRYVVYAFSPYRARIYFDGAYGVEDARVVQVTNGGVTPDVDITLHPIYYLAPENDMGRAAVTITGRVTDARGQGVADATVQILNADEEPVATASTGQEGSFEISGVPPGRYLIYAGKRGYQAAFNGGSPSFAEATPIPMNGGVVEVNLMLADGTGTGREPEDESPRSLTLLGNYPNPFNPQTTIVFRTATASDVQLVVYNVLGEVVVTLVDGPVTPGVHEVQWDGRDRRSRPVASGTYFYRLRNEADGVVKSMVLVR